MCASGVRLRPVRVVQFPKRRRPTATHGDVMDCVHLTRHQCSREPTHTAKELCARPMPMYARPHEASFWYCTKVLTRTRVALVAHRHQHGSIVFSAHCQDRPQVSRNVCQSCKSFSWLEPLIFLSLNFGCLCCLLWVVYGSFRNFYFCSCVNLHIRERNDGSNLNFRLDGWGVYSLLK